MTLSVDSALGDLLANAQARAILDRHVPGLTSYPQLSMGKGFPLRTVAGYAPDVLTPEVLAALDADLRAIGADKGADPGSPAAPGRAGSARVERLLSQLTLEEKVSLLAGATLWTTPPIERLGIPALKVTDGPSGARGGAMPGAGGLTSANFPSGIALASTWNTELVQQVGAALAEEAQTKGAQVLLAPTINIDRSPLNGRNFENYSEDPYLVARMAVAYINGLQSRGVSACVKHYVCNDSEFERNSISSDVRERPLREIYLAPFKVAVQEAHAWAVMSSYNRVNGTYASENPRLLTEILRGEWGFDGLVMSDWTGTYSTAEAVNAGLDLEMPGPTRWRGEKLLQAVAGGQVQEATIAESVRRLLVLMERTGRLDNPQDAPEQAVDRPEHRAVARQAAAEGIVLLKNRGDLLPLPAAALKTLALIGPNVKTPSTQGGGSAGVTPHYVVTPWDAITARVGESTTVRYEPGCTIARMVPLVDSALLAQGEWRLEFFDNRELAGAPVLSRWSDHSEWRWFGEVGAGVNPGRFSARISTRIRPQETGAYVLSLASAGCSRLLLDGKALIDLWEDPAPGSTYFGMGTDEEKARINLTAGREYLLTAEFRTRPLMVPIAALRIGFALKTDPEQMLASAARAAAESDLALVFVGSNDEWESEGFDRPDMDLPGAQNALIERVTAANPRTVVVLNTGSPVAMPWLDRVAAVVQIWFPGQECGHAIADVLWGDTNPSGRLPQTFPARLEDNPAYLNYPGENGHVNYGEGLFVGYRYYERKKIAPLFPFGFGLSYTTFGYSPLRLSAPEIGPEDTLQVAVDVTNTGRRAGKEVVQLYVRDVQSSLQRPEKELKAFAKVALEPGESKTVTLTLDRAALAFYDDKAQAWVAEAGEFEVLVGASTQDIRARASFRLTATSQFSDAEGTYRSGNDVRLSRIS